jgi:hypothetical protein
LRPVLSLQRTRGIQKKKTLDIPLPSRKDVFSLRKRLRSLLKALMQPAPQQRRLGTDEPNVKDLLPSRSPLLPDLRPGRHHREIHDARYLQQILAEELKAAKPPSLSQQASVREVGG